MQDKLKTASAWIKNSRHTAVFTGAGISVESGIPPFRGPGGIWNRYNPELLDLEYFRQHPKQSWEAIQSIVYDFTGKIKPNPAHLGLAELEKAGFIKTIITQNIDFLHHEAGSKNVYEFHGTARTISCLQCKRQYLASDIPMELLPPVCNPCGGLLKPDFVFFGEAIPSKTAFLAFAETHAADVFVVIGTTGDVMPAGQIPIEAKLNGARIIEINPESSNFTHHVTDLFLQGQAGDIIPQLVREIL